MTHICVNCGKGRHTACMPVIYVDNDFISCACSANSHKPLPTIVPSGLNKTTEPSGYMYDIPEGYYLCGKCRSVIPVTFWHWCNDNEAHCGLSKDLR